MATEKRLVYASEVEEIFNHEVHMGATDLFDAFDSAIENATTVDAVEVVHGRWIEKIDVVASYLEEEMRKARMENQEQGVYFPEDDPDKW